MFGDTPLKMTSSLTWSDQNGFNRSVSYNLLTEEQLDKEAAKAAQKGAQQNQGNLFLNIMDGLGYNLGGRESEPTVWNDITGAFTKAWDQITNPMDTLSAIGDGFSKLGKGIAGLASSAWDGITGLFGGKSKTDYEISLLLAKKAEQIRREPIMTVAWDRQTNIMNDASGSEVDIKSITDKMKAGQSLTPEKTESLKIFIDQKLGKGKSGVHDSTIFVRDSLSNTNEKNNLTYNEALIAALLQDGEIHFNQKGFTAAFGIGLSISYTTYIDSEGKVYKKWDAQVAFGLGTGAVFIQGTIDTNTGFRKSNAHDSLSILI